MLPIEEYLALQGRFGPFRADPDHVAAVQRGIDEKWEWLREQQERSRAVTAS